MVLSVKPFYRKRLETKKKGGRGNLACEQAHVRYRRELKHKRARRARNRATNPRNAGDCCVFKFIRRSVDGKYFMLFSIFSAGRRMDGST